MNKVLYPVALVLAVCVGIVLVDNVNKAIENSKTIEIAKVLASEGCGEGKVGMYFVANTIRNRAEKDNKSPYQIIKEPFQYAGIDNPNKEVLYAECKEFADEMAKNIMVYPDLTDGALFFRQPREEKRAWHNIETVRWMNHIFYK